MSFWKIGGLLGGVALLGFVAYLLITGFGRARYNAGKADSDSAWSQKVIQAERSKLAAYQAGVASVDRAEAVYHETVRDRIIPVTKTIIERSTAYAQTPDGQLICLPADRVLALDQARSTLFPPAASAPAARDGNTVRSDAPRPQL